MRLKPFIILLFAFVVINQVVTLTLAEESQKREPLTEGETTDVIIKRLEAMEAALAQVAGSQLPLEVPETELIQKTEEGFDESRTFLQDIEKYSKKVQDEAEMEAPLPKSEILLAAGPPKERKGMAGMVFWLVGLSLISGLGFLLWRKISLNTDKRIKELKSELQEKNKLLEQSEITHKAIEKATLQNEKEKQQPQERRTSPRLDLSRDYNRTIILRIESPDKSKSIKSFANNISSGGLCFETRKDFEESQIINLRLFFFGDKVPMIKIQAQIVWKKIVLPVNYYGVSFASLEEKGEIELNRYIESKIS